MLMTLLMMVIVMVMMMVMVVVMGYDELNAVVIGKAEALLQHHHRRLSRWR